MVGSILMMVVYSPDFNFRVSTHIVFSHQVMVGANHEYLLVTPTGSGRCYVNRQLDVYAYVGICLFTGA